jgi:hypothetical protein
MLGNSLKIGLASVCAALLLAGCGSNATEPPPPPPSPSGYTLTIQRALVETVAGACDPEVAASNPFAVSFLEDEGQLRMEVVNRGLVWEGMIATDGSFHLTATRYPEAWIIDLWTATGSLSPDRTSLTGIEEWRGGGEEDFCHGLVQWSGGAG